MLYYNLRPLIGALLSARQKRLASWVVLLLVVALLLPFSEIMFCRRSDLFSEDEMLHNVEQAKQLAAKWLREDESFRMTPYRDPGDESLRIGYGGACEESLLEQTWGRAELRLVEDLEKCASDVYVYLGSKMTPQFNVVRLAVLYCMTYQMGYGGLCSFEEMKRCLVRDDWEGVAFQMTHNAARPNGRSQWHDDTPERCERMALLMLRGKE